MEYTLRQRDFESNRTLYEGLLQRLRTAGSQAGLESMEIDIVDKALPPASPKLQPQSTDHHHNPDFQYPGWHRGVVPCWRAWTQGCEASLRLKALQSCRRWRLFPRARRSTAEEASNLSTAQRNLSLLTQPKSQFAEAFRSLRTSLLLSHAGSPPKYILFTQRNAILKERRLLRAILLVFWHSRIAESS